MSSPNRIRLTRRRFGAAGCLCLVLAATSTAATLPSWLQHILAATPDEQALYRVMHLPALEALYPRPAKEAEAEAAKLPDSTLNLYALRARADEAALDEAAAEADWKSFAAQAKDTGAARLELADFYARRLAIPQEMTTLREVAEAPPLAEETYLDPARQRSWRAFSRMLALAADQALPPAQTRAIFDAFLTRYPKQPAVYARALTFLVEQKDPAAADALIARFRQQIPDDTTFPIRAEALVAQSRQGPAAALAIYDQNFQPLWPSPLIQSYLALLDQAHRQRAFVAEARAGLAAHPDGTPALNALARIFYYDQQAGRTTQAQGTLDSFRIARETRGGKWSPEDLYTLAALETVAQNNAEAARYQYALASTPGTLPNGRPAAETGLSALIDLLLRASTNEGSAAGYDGASSSTAGAGSGQPLALGAGNLSLYRDIATLDQGPGYWNGILSLWLNGTSPEREYESENSKAQTYFHRSKAAELLVQLDGKFPQAAERPSLHAQLIAAEAQYGEPATVVAEGKQYLTDYPASPARFQVANLLADAYARQKDTATEFALYDTLLNELAGKTNGLPLTASSTRTSSANAPTDPNAGPDPNASPDDAPTPQTAPVKTGDLDLITAYPPRRATLPEGDQYQQILDRYLGRLVATQQLPQALALLRRQLDHNPNDPLLYERLASFLQQNNLSAPQEEVFKLAYAKFSKPTYYDRLARLYLREKRREAYAALTRQVVDIFSGTDLDRYFSTVVPSAKTEAGPQLALQLNLYAAKRFPHDLVFTRNLLTAYQSKPTVSAAAYDALLRRQWWAADDLRDQFFSYLSRTGKLQAELAQLGTITGTGTPAPGGPLSAQPLRDTGASTAALNPAALHELAEGSLWISHPEQSAPLFSTLADLYPANVSEDDRAVSIFRSLSYLDATPASLTRAVAIEQNLLRAAPDSPDRLATLGDLYAEATDTGGEDLAQAIPYWRRLPTLHAGTPAGALTSASIFWDYFQYDDALAEIKQARQRFASPTLFGYQAGAIEENRGDLPAAVAEYTAVVIHPAGERFFSNSLDAAVLALLKPPSDAADSNLQSTAQDLFNSAEARDRLLHLAARPTTAALADRASADAVAAAATPAALTLRADVLIAEHREGELPALLTAALARASTVEDAAAIGDLARSHSSAPPGSEAALREVDVTLDPTDPKVAKKYAPAAGYALVAVYEAALAREATLTPDPVQAIQFQYEQAASLEARKQRPAAQAIMEHVYQANPRSLGVVRATTDFFARTQQPPRAIATLLEAAKVAIPKLARDFTLEAANRANNNNDPKQARALVTPLLAQTPYDPTVLGVIAASYARANDNAGLKAFYLAELDQAQKDPALDREARRENVAVLRRGLIPALTRLHDDAGAEAQYIALLSAFPEDSSTAQQAALYALAHNLQPQLLEFLKTTVKASPNDSRFFVLLAEVEATFEDLPAALGAYDAALKLRKDRVDLYTARADLELRLAAGDPALLERAASDFDRLYTLSYRDPQYQVRVAEIRARQGRASEAVKALAVAYPATGINAISNVFAAAAQLEQWNLLAEALTAAQQGVRLAGGKLLTEPTAPGARIYARILTRLGKPDQALATLSAAARSAEVNAPSTAELQADSGGPDFSAAGSGGADAAAGGDDAALRKSLLEQRRETIAGNLRSALAGVGETVQLYFTPEQKTAYGVTLDTLHTTNPQRAIEAANAAGFADREATWRKQQLLAKPAVTAPGTADLAAALQSYIALQQHRLRFADLAQTLEAYAAQQPPEARLALKQQAAKSWRIAGDETNELRVLRALPLADNAALRDRFFDLLLAHDRAALTSIAAGKDATLADAAVNYAVEHAAQRPAQTQALATIAARARSLPAVWRPASSALACLYFADPTLPPDQAKATAAGFTEALASDLPIGGRIGKPADAARQLTGDDWFFYGSRYGIFLNLPAAKGNAAAPPAADAAEDFLPARLEQSPASPAAYLDLAQTYAEAGNLPAAQAEYTHVLELAPNGAAALTAHDQQAELLFRLNHREQAIAEWRAALALIAHLQDRNNYPERFYTGFLSVSAHVAEHHVDLTPELSAIVRLYLTRNGNYRSNELLEAVYQASPSPAAGAALIVSLADSGMDPDVILSDLAHVTWLSPQAQQTLLLHRLELARRAPQPVGEESTQGNAQVTTISASLLSLYFTNNDYARAEALLATISVSASEADELASARLRVAAHAGRLEALLATLRTAPAPSDADANAALDLNAFNTAADALSTPRATPADLKNALLLRQYVFEQKQSTHTLLATDFVALAELHLQTGDLPGALTILRRLSLQPVAVQDASAASSPDALPSALLAPPNPYANIDAAAAVLEADHHAADALPFLESLVQTVPWNAGYRLRLAQAQAGAGRTAEAQPALAAIAKDPAAPYTTRTQAARALAGPGATAVPELGSRELTLLARSSFTPAEARQPFFTEARLELAARPQTAAADRILLLREALALTPNGVPADQTRLDLLLAEGDTANPPTDLAALARQVGQAPAASAYASDETDGSAAGAAEDEESDGAAPDSVDTASSGQPVSLPALAVARDLPTQVRLLLILSNVSLREEHNPETAFAYLELAQRLSSQGAQANPGLTLRLKNLKAQIDLDRRNLLRRPTFSAALGQPNPVRNRLTLAQQATGLDASEPKPVEAR